MWRVGRRYPLRTTAFAVHAALFAGAAAAQSSGQLEEIVVTAQMVTESLQDAEVAITAVSGDLIAATGIKDVLDLESQLPGVTFSESGLTSILVRGIGTVNNQPGVDSAVLYSQDGTYMSHLQALPPMMFDIERVEVVRGPQGTLYGRNSNGGSLNIITRRPTLDELQFGAGVTVGSYDTLDMNFVANVPVAEGFAIRAAVATDKSDPYFEDGSEGTDNYAARVRMLFAPSDDFDFIATLEYSEVDDTGVGFAYCPPNSDKPACDGYPWRPYQGFGAPGTFGTPEGPHGENPNYLTRENWGAYGELNYRLDRVTLTAITNWHKYDMSNRYVWDTVTDYRPIHKDDFITQEVRLASAPGSRIEWVSGLFYGREKLDALEYFDFNGRPGIRLRVPDGNMDTKALFGQVTVPVSERFSFIGGVRRTYERKVMPGSSTVFDSAGNPITIQTGDTPLLEERTTWNVGFRFDRNDDSMIYGKVANGFKSGGVNQVPAGLGLVEVYLPEEIVAVQVGAKNRFLGNRLQLNGELFHYDYKDYQAITTVTDPTGFFPGNFFSTINVQDATFYGGEIEMLYRLSPANQLDVYYTRLHGEFEGNPNEPGNAPNFTIGVGYQHWFNLAGGGEVQARITTQYMPGHYTSNSNFAASYRDSFTRTNANVMYKPPRSPWSVNFWVTNLEDKAVIRQGQMPTSRPGDNAFMLPPRFWGVSFNWSL